MNVKCKQCGTGPSSRSGQVARARRWFPAAVRGATAVLLATGALLAASQSNAQTTPSVTIEAASVRVEEGVDIVLTATLSQALATAHTVPLSVTDEYFAVDSGSTPPSEFSFAANATTATADFETDDDEVEGGARQVTFTLEPTSDVQLGTPWSVSVWVDDNDAPPGAPRNLTATPGLGAVRVEWDPPAYTSGGTITKYEYRQSSNDGVTWHPGWMDAGLSTHKTVTGLTGGTEYTFEVRAVSSTAGDGARAEIKGTPFDLAGAGFDLALSSATVVEGGPPVTATVRTGNGRTFPGLLSLTISWGADVINETDLLQVAGVANPQFVSQVDLPPHTSSATFQVEAQTSDEVYRPPTRRMLRIGAAGAVLAETPLTLMDDEPVPVATLSATATTTVMSVTATSTVMSVTEGEEFDLNVFLSQEVHPDFADEPVHMTVTDATGALTGTLPTSATIPAGQTAAIQTVMTDDDTDHGGARTVTFTLTRSPQSIYTLGDPSSWTMTVLDNDAPPGAPRNLAAHAGDTKATLAWEAPADHGDTAITKFQYRQGALNSADPPVLEWGAWTDVPGGDGSSRTVEVSSLTNDTEYTFEVRAVNTNGEGPESNQAMVTPASTAVAVTWELSLFSDTIREGGNDVTATVHITGPVFDADQSILLTWDDCHIGEDTDILLAEVPCVASAVKGLGEAGYSKWIVVPAGKRQGSLVLTAPPTTSTPLRSFFAYTYDTEVVATLGTTEIGRAPLQWVDAAPKPELSIEVFDPTTRVILRGSVEVVEGEAIAARIRLSPTTRIGNSNRAVQLTVTDAGGVLQRPLPGREISALVRWLRSFRHLQRFTLQTEDSTATTGARVVTVEHSHYRDLDARFYTLAGPALTVSVLDRDTTASAPQSFKAEPANGAVVLTWTAPAANGAAVEKYRYRESTDGGTNYGSWTDIPDSDADTTAYRVMGRTNGTAYTYQVQAFNRSGGGAESAAATATPMGATWGITLAVWPVMGPADDLTKIVEGGQQLRVTLRSTNNVTFSKDQDVRGVLERQARGRGQPRARQRDDHRR